MVDNERALAWLKRQWPGVTIWHGQATGHWWALLGDGLVEVETPKRLHELLVTRLA